MAGIERTGMGIADTVLSLATAQHPDGPPRKRPSLQRGSHRALGDISNRKAPTVPRKVAPPRRDDYTTRPVASPVTAPANRGSFQAPSVQPKHSARAITPDRSASPSSMDALLEATAVVSPLGIETGTSSFSSVSASAGDAAAPTHLQPTDDSVDLSPTRPGGRHPQDGCVAARGPHTAVTTDASASASPPQDFAQLPAQGSRHDRPPSPSALSTPAAMGKADGPAVQQLKLWLHANQANPYPDPATTQALALIAKITPTQVTNWMAQARGIMKVLVEKKLDQAPIRADRRCPQMTGPWQVFFDVMLTEVVRAGAAEALDRSG